MEDLSASPATLDDLEGLEMPADLDEPELPTDLEELEMPSDLDSSGGTQPGDAGS